jgi:hypothetical protein
LLRRLEGRVLDVVVTRDLASVAADLRALPGVQRVQEFATERDRGRCRLLLPGPDVSGDVDRFIRGAGIADITMAAATPNLEDVFFALTRREVEA